MTFLFIYSLILIFQLAIRKVRGEDLTTIAKTLEASISQELNLEYEIEVDEYTTFTLSGILPIFNYQKRTIGIIENGTWAPMAGKLMKAYVEQFKDCTLVEPIVTIKSTMNEDTVKVMEELADTMLQSK